MNIPEQYIITTEDKVHLCLDRHIKHVESSKAWMTPAGIVATLAATLFAADFHDFGPVHKELLKAIFIVCMAASIIWLAKTAIAIRHAKTVDDVICDLKTHGLPYTIDKPGEVVQK